MFGADTGSADLRAWARLELSGYDQQPVPAYRQIQAMLVIDTINDRMWATGQGVTRSQVPKAAREYVSEYVPFGQPVEELALMSERKDMKFGNNGLAMAQSVWNQELGPFQQIVSMAYTVPGAVLAGVVGQVRTNLVELIADLTTGLADDEMPSTSRVDAAVQERILHVGDTYNGPVVHNSGAGPVAVGANASATSGFTVAQILELLDGLIGAARDVPGWEQEEFDRALVEVREAIAVPAPDTAVVMRRTGRLKETAEKLGTSGLSAAVSSAVSAIVGQALTGGFG